MTQTVPPDEPIAPSLETAFTDRSGDDRRAKLKQTLIDQAWRLLSTEGLSAMQARRVAQAAGCSVGAIYNVFPDLDELILWANARTLGMLAGHLRGALTSARPGLPKEERLALLAHSYVAFACERETAWCSLFDYRLTYRKPYPAWYRSAQLEAFGVLASVFSDHPADLARRLAETLWAAVHGVLAAGLDQRLHERSDIEIRAQIDLLLRLVSPTLAR